MFTIHHYVNCVRWPSQCCVLEVDNVLSSITQIELIGRSGTWLKGMIMVQRNCKTWLQDCPGCRSLKSGIAWAWAWVRIFPKQCIILFTRSCNFERPFLYSSSIQILNISSDENVSMATKPTNMEALTLRFSHHLPLTMLQSSGPWALIAVKKYSHNVQSNTSTIVLTGVACCLSANWSLAFLVCPGA
jgi:hypothetical protein